MNLMNQTQIQFIKMEHIVKLDFSLNDGMMSIIDEWQNCLLWCNHFIGEKGVDWDIEVEAGLLVKPVIFKFQTVESATAFKLAWV